MKANSRFLLSVIVVLTATSSFSADIVVVNGRRVYNDSIEVVPVAQNSGQVYVSRTVLTPAELSENISFIIFLSRANAPELQPPVEQRDNVTNGENPTRNRPSEPTYVTVENWLRSEGFKIFRPPLPDYLTVYAYGTVAQVQKSMQVKFVRVHSGDREFSSANTPPSLPAEISQDVSSISGLQPHISRFLPMRVNGLMGR